MKSTLILTFALLATSLALPLASADFVPPCTPSGETSVVNNVQYRANCWTDKAQEEAYELYCDLACPYL